MFFVFFKLHGFIHLSHRTVDPDKIRLWEPELSPHGQDELFLYPGIFKCIALFSDSVDQIHFIETVSHLL